MDIYLIDGTYELFRHFYAVPEAADDSGQEIGAVRGVLASVMSLLERGVTHLGVATDHVIESFRNELYPEYKTGEGVQRELMSQFPILEESLVAMGVKVWPETEFEADDALAAAAARAVQDERVSKVFICTPDKDLAQSVVGEKIVQFDRMRNTIRDEAGVIARFGVKPESIPDYLAVVGDTADGYPGLPGWGAKAASSVLSIYPHLEDIPNDVADWSPTIRNARKLSATLFERWDDAVLYRRLARLRLDVPVFENVDELLWRGLTPSFDAVAARLNAKNLLSRAARVRAESSLS